jgi:hypothetical protein
LLVVSACSYFNHQSLCWSGKVENGCFENTTGPLGEPVTGLDLHNGTEVANSSEYSTTLYTTEAARIIAAHAAEHGVGRGERHVPLFLYLPHQAVHVGNLPEETHPEYARDQAPPEYIERFQHIEDEQRRNLSAMVVRDSTRFRYSSTVVQGRQEVVVSCYVFRVTCFVIWVSSSIRSSSLSDQCDLSPCCLL